MAVPTELQEMPHPDLFQPEMSDEVRVELIAPAIARVVLRHHNTAHDLSIGQLDDGEAVEAAQELDRTVLSKRYASTFTPSEVVPWDPERQAARRDEFDARLAWYAARGIDAGPLLARLQVVNLGTEDDIAGYRHQLPPDAWHPMLRMWNRSWKADEVNHSILGRRDVEATGVFRYLAPDDVGGSRETRAAAGYAEYERARSTYSYNETSVEITGQTQGRVYPGQQELGTYFPHEIYAHLAGGSSKEAHGAIAKDEMKHYVAYRDMLIAEMQLAIESGDPSYVNHVAATIVSALHPAQFAMPASGRMENYDQYAKAIAVAGVFDESTIRSIARRFTKEIGFVEFADHITDPHVQAAAAEFMENIQDDSDANQRFVRVLDRRRSGILERLPDDEPKPLILGHTVELHIRNPDMSEAQRSGVYVADDGADKVKVIAA